MCCTLACLLISLENAIGVSWRNDAVRWRHRRTNDITTLVCLMQDSLSLPYFTLFFCLPGHSIGHPQSFGSSNRAYFSSKLSFIKKTEREKERERERERVRWAWKVKEWFFSYSFLNVCVCLHVSPLPRTHPMGLLRLLGMSPYLALVSLTNTEPFLTNTSLDINIAFRYSDRYLCVWPRQMRVCRFFSLSRTPCLNRTIHIRRGWVRYISPSLICALLPLSSKHQPKEGHKP
jgi:hypothetical protein